MLQDVTPPAACCGRQTNFHVHMHTLQMGANEPTCEHIVRTVKKIEFSQCVTKLQHGWVIFRSIFVCLLVKNKVLFFYHKSLIWWKYVDFQVNDIIQNQANSKCIIISFNCKILKVIKTPINLVPDQLNPTYSNTMKSYSQIQHQLILFHMKIQLTRLYYCIWKKVI